MTYATKHRRPAPIIEAEFTPVPEEGRLVPFQEEAATAETIEVSWDRARALWGEATRGADAIIELAFLLVKIKQDFLYDGSGARTDLKPSAATKRGWEKIVESELGINQQRARRLIEKGDALFRLKTLSQGHEVEWVDADGQPRTTTPTPETSRLAAEILPDVVSGLVSARRAWAGVCGEGSRSEIGKQRAEVDHAAVMLRAIRSVRSSLKQWNNLQPGPRADVETAWADLLNHIPQTWQGAPKK